MYEILSQHSMTHNGKIRQNHHTNDGKAVIHNESNRHAWSFIFAPLHVEACLTKGVFIFGAHAVGLRGKQYRIE
jgi:hypothetical protein